MSYLRLIRPGVATPKRRTEFLAMAATVLRSVLIDQTRGQLAHKNGGHQQRVSHGGRTLAPKQEVDLPGLDEALTRLAALDPRQARLVELKFSGGLAIDAVAVLLEVSARPVDNDWKMAWAWLHCELTRGA
ncbi:MAG: RNA polymerase subunit sigma-24 [Planctomycetes bacterium]|nr:RNA polymerase subunit sigma-24 [Planctomycetota bacterium]